MGGVARTFFLSSLVFGLAGLVLGNVMAASHDHTQLPTHAHTMVVGWLSFAVFGMFYHQFPAAAAGVLAKVHLAVAEISLLVLLVGLLADQVAELRKERFEEPSSFPLDAGRKH